MGERKLDTQIFHHWYSNEYEYQMSIINEKSKILRKDEMLTDHRQRRMHKLIATSDVSNMSARKLSVWKV